MFQQAESPFPTNRQLLLLQAALLSGNDMLSAWKKWKEEVDFENEVEHASFRLLPLLYQNLHQHKIDDPLIDRLKGIYRKAWSHNHLLFYKCSKVLDLLHKNDTPTIVMKGIALSVLIYKNHSVRPMADMDILVPFQKAEKTIDVLKKDGWALQDEQYVEHNLKYGRSATFYNSEHTELDLHWHPIFEAHESISDSDFWKPAVSLEVAGTKTKAFCITDNLFHTIVHGLRYNAEPPIRWVADAVKILNFKDDPIDWDRLLHHTKKFRVTLQMKAAMAYLVTYFKAPVPERFLTDLQNTKVIFADRVVFRHAKKFGDKIPETFYEKLYTIYADYLRQSDKTSLWDQHIGFIKYMRYRTKGKPYFKVMMYYLSLFFKNKKQINPDNR